MRPIRIVRVLLLTLLIGCPACKKPPPGPNGATCTSNIECQSDLCFHQICLDPLADDDGDGLVNKVEVLLTGTLADNPDSDGDGLSDLEEVGDNPSSPVDSDDDGVHNAMESILKDSDCDGDPDQHDNPAWENQDGATGVPDPEDPDNCLPDNDQDGVENGQDNCPELPNPEQDDEDQDGFGTPCDLCPDGPDDEDTDGDDIPDACDLCFGQPDGIDLDGDGVPSGCDICPGGDDGGPDEDGDGVPEDCDICPQGDDNGLDGDKDGVPIECDTCAGFDDLADADQDGIADGCDVCPQGDDNVDTDADGVADACDVCPEGPPGCGGLCASAADCDDENPCSDDACDETTGACVQTLAAGCECLLATDCDDGDPCTHDTCTLDGTCGHETISGCCVVGDACDDGVPCTTDVCDATTHQCSHESSDGLCDDGYGCTQHICDPSIGCVETSPAVGTKGLSVDHEGSLLWNVFVDDGPEPTAQGHLVCGEPAFYYLASRDYDGIDPESPGSFHLTEANPTEFGGLLEALENTGHTLEQIHWKVGLMSLDDDEEGEDWWWETGQVEVRNYYPVSQSNLVVTLNGTAMLSGTLEYVRSRTVFPIECDATPTDISGHTSPAALLNLANTDSDAYVVAEALLADLAGDGLQIRFSSFQPAIGQTYDEGGRIGAFFETQSGSVARVPLVCEGD